MNEITYQNKVALNENPEIADINKVTDSDMNEIKSVVNGNSRTSSNNFGLGTNTWTSSATYSIGDIVVYNDNTYKNLTGTNTTTTPDQDNTNWEVMPLIVNEYNTSTKNAYSCDYTNNLVEEVYSTDEIKTNKTWTDGKPIYKKTFITTNIGTFSHNISNVDTIFIDASASFNKKTTGNITPISYLSVSGDSGCWFVNTEVFSPFGAFSNVSSATITVFYTKTTD